MNIYCHVELIRRALSLDSEILELAERLCKKKSLILMGRGFNFATCLEGALVSLKMSTYTFRSICSIYLLYETDIVLWIANYSADAHACVLILILCNLNLMDKYTV